MNIKKTNPIGSFWAEDGVRVFKRLKISSGKLSEGLHERTIQSTDFIFDNSIYNFDKNTKVLRLTKQIYDNCKLIDIDSIKENVTINDFKYDSLFILLHNDDEGVIKIERKGSDFSYMYVADLSDANRAKNKFTFNTYSFLTKEFLNDEVNKVGQNYELSVFVIQLLTYLYYGDIVTKTIQPKGEVKISSFSKFINNSKIPITYIDSLWKQRISTDGFKVRGHFRFQPIGEKRIDKKLIWIEEFKKDGYNRKATVELI